MASVTTPCVYKSITLAAGEQFTLPPGAELVASSAGIAAVKSTCALPDTLEEPVCYKFKFSGAEQDGGNATQNWSDAGNFQVKGIVVNGIFYSFPNIIYLTQSGTARQALTWSDAMNGIPQFSGLFTFLNGDPVYGDENDTPGAGFTYQVAFNTIPSIGDTLEFQSSTVTETQAPFSGLTTIVYTKGTRC